MTQFIKISTLFFVCLCTVFVVNAQSLPDSEIKKNISSISDPLRMLVQLEPKIYEYDTQKFRHLKLQQGQRYGFLAENVQSVMPGLVGERNVSYMYGKNSYRDATIKTVNETALITLLVAAVKEQQLQIEALRKELAEIKKSR